MYVHIHIYTSIQRLGFGKVESEGQLNEVNFFIHIVSQSFILSIINSTNID